MKKLIYRRIVAFAIDYLVIIGYALLLFGFTKILNLRDFAFSPISGQLIGFASLTLPVFLYFFLMERGVSRATLGKRIMNISIELPSDNSNSKIFLRNVLKFLPWEIAHTGVHWIVYCSNSGNEVPIWVYLLLILPQIIMLVYFISMMITRGASSIYDNLADTRIKLTQDAEGTKA